ncbi:MAG: methyltransferase [Chitinophagaceae bacterium]
MANSYFRFKQFTVHQELAAMKVTTDGCLFGAWVAAQLEKGNSSAQTILDIGAGTGLLSLMLAQKTASTIDAIEVDMEAATQAMSNFTQSPWKERLKIIHQDIHQFNTPHDYPIIVSNPPFYEKDLTGKDPKKNIAHHHAGLLLQDLVKIIRNKLTSENGHFFLLIPEKRLEETLTIIRQLDLRTYRICKVRQSVDHDFFRALIHGGNTEHDDKMLVEELSIRDSNNEYTEAFIALLRDYYLYL